MVILKNCEKLIILVLAPQLVQRPTAKVVSVWEFVLFKERPNIFAGKLHCELKLFFFEV